MPNSLKSHFNKDFDLSSHPSLHASLQKKYQQAQSAFSQYAPHLIALLQQHDSQFDIFFNKNNEMNIGQSSTQQTIYGISPSEEVRNEVDSFLGSPTYVSLTDEANVGEPVTEIDVILVFGIGLGQHLAQLLERIKINYLIIYEPSSSMLRCSTFQLDWQHFLDKATRLGTAVSLQIAKPASELLDNLAELIHFKPSVSKIYLYRHLCFPIYDEIINYLLDNSGNSKALTKTGMHFLGYNESYSYVPIKAGKALLTLSPTLLLEPNALFTNNIQALSYYYPELATTFSHYQPQNWFPAFDQNNEINLYHNVRKCFLFRQRDIELQLALDGFKAEGSKGLSLMGQAIPRKLRDYEHFKTLTKIRHIEKNHTKLIYKQTEKVSNLVIFGCSALFNAKYVEACTPDNLILFEQEPDFFYASLFLVDWSTILTQFANDNKKLSLNIGIKNGFSVSFFRLVQYSKRPNLESTAFIELSYSKAYKAQIQELKSDIQSSQAVNDYFDHARLGMNHSLQNIQAGAKFLKQTTTLMPYMNFPVFIVGNGPSLDELIPYIKEYQHRCLIVSCGTALSALMAYDIVPDFHAEAEQNRSTFRLISNVKNPAKLKDISLISFSSVHPDTAALFKDTYLAFKEAEAATGFIKACLPVSERSNYIELQHAYPTVSNVAFSFITAAGFKDIYLMGVDFGQVESGRHHSAMSIYYKDDGSEIYDVEKHAPYNKTILGNFRPKVKTKPEFDMARRTLEIAIGQLSAVQVYNCSDGARIAGTTPLKPENILFEQSAINKATAIQQLHARFTELLDANFERFKFESMDYSGLEEWCKKYIETPKTIAEAEAFLESSWAYLQEYVFNKSALFEVLYYNSLNYFFQSLGKVLQLDNYEEKALMNDFNLINIEIVKFVEETICSLQQDGQITCKAGTFV